MVDLWQLVQASSTCIPRRFWLFLAVLLLSSHQATILAYGFFGKEAIAANIEQLNDAFIPNSLVLSYIGELGIVRISFWLAVYAILLFLVQSVLALIYTSFNSVKGRRATVLAIWLLPALLGLPTRVITAAYLMSPLYAISTFLDLCF